MDYKSDRSAQSIVEWAFRETKKIALRRLGAKGKPQMQETHTCLQQTISDCQYSDDCDIVYKA